MSRSVLEINEDIAILRFTRGEKLNAFDYDSWRDFSLNIDKALKYKGLIITGEGRAFSTGDDIYAMYSLKNYGESKEFFDMLYNVIEKIMHYPHPIVAAVNGLAVGGGAEILLATDYVISVKDAWFWFPEVRIGLYPPILVSLGIFIFGVREVKRLAIEMPKISIEEALNLGLVDMVIENSDTLLKSAFIKVKELNKVPSSSYSHIRNILANTVLPYLKYSIDILAKTVVTEEAKKWMELFIKSKESKET